MMVTPELIKTIPPGEKGIKVIRRSNEVSSPSLSRPYPLVVFRGEGCYVEDPDGNRFLDFGVGAWTVGVGYGHPTVVEALKAQAERLVHHPQDYGYTESYVELLDRLVKMLPGRFRKRGLLTACGSEAVEAALKMVRWHTRKPKVVAFIGSGHGSTLGALSISSRRPVERRHFQVSTHDVVLAPYPNCLRCPFGKEVDECDLECLRFLEEYLLKYVTPPEDVAAVFIEPIQTETCIQAPDRFMKGLKSLSDGYGIPIVVDECWVGIGRTGRWLAAERWNLELDAVCLSRGLASGLPLGALLSRESLMDWEAGCHTSLYGGNPVSCAAALATLDVMEEEHLVGNASTQGLRLLRMLKDLCESSEVVGNARGYGLAVAVDVVSSQRPRRVARDLVLTCFRRGLILSLGGDSTVRFTPALCVSREEVERAYEIFEESVRDVESAL